MKTLPMVAIASLFLAVGAQAQKKSEPAPGDDSFFSSDSNLVLVDSIVTDKKGAYIDDLTRKDFTVREDGKAQTITSFSYLADGTPNDQKHFLVLLFDNSTVPRTAQLYAREAAMRFIGANAGPGRYMAVAEFDNALRVTQNLTDDAVRLKAAVNGSGVSMTAADTANARPPVFGRPTTDTVSVLPRAVQNLARGMARVPGRKTVLLFSQGVSINEDEVKRTIEECNRANVAIYPVDIHALNTRGAGETSVGNAALSRSQLTYSPPNNPLATRQADLSALSEVNAPQSAPNLIFGLAKGTGGFVVSSSDRLTDDLNKVGKEESQYYQLGYLPNEPKPGTCHAIKVAVDRSGANVRARSSYCDEKLPEIQLGTPTERDLEARLNGNATSNIPATALAPFFYVAPNTARVDLALEIPGAAMKFTKDKGKFAAALSILGIAYFPDGGVAARFSDTAKVVLDDQQQVDEFTSRPYRFEKQFEMASGQFSLKLAFSSGGASFGRVEKALVIDAWEPSKFLLSGLALSQTTRPAAPAGLSGEVDLLGDQVPLVANAVQFIPAGTNRLRKSEKTFIYAEIYEPALAGPDRKGDPGLGVQLSLLDAKTGAIVKRTGVRGVKPEALAGTPAVPLGMSLPVDELAPGSYTAQIDAQDAAGNHALRRVAFELEP